jgi:hypothetical protein
MIEDPALKLSNEVQQSHAYRISLRLQHLQVNFFVAARNYQELKRLTERVNTGHAWFHLWDLKNRDKLDGVTNEKIRLFHNFLASSKSLVDHTRIVIRAWYKGEPFYQEYSGEVKARFTDDPMVAFMERLRNYSLHYSLPFAAAHLSIQFPNGPKDSEATFSFKTSRDALSAWDGWTGTAKEYLRGLPEDIDVDSLAENYFGKITEFYVWMHNRLMDIHRAELDWLDEMRRKLIAAMPDDERDARGLKID